ncbi:MAG: YdcF family protein [Erysipelotrichaceae bacterium]|nr:YdcF family protein [Erysipelotrichaceae bacterium]
MNIICRILAVLGMAFIIYGLTVLLLIKAGSIFNFFFLILGLLCMSVALCWEKVRSYIPDDLRKILYVPVVVSVCFFLIIECKIISYADKESADDAEYVILLGSQMKEDGPSMDYRARIDTAYEYLVEHPSAMIICTGAKGDKEPVSEAEGARKYLLEKGIADERIIVEDNSYSTLQNIANARDIILKRGGDLSETGIVIVSARYHLFRAAYLAGKFGFESVSAKGGMGLFILQPHYYCREFFGYLKELIVFMGR